MVENLPLFFQVGRTFFNCRYKKPSKLFQCCGVSERPNLFYYHKQNKMQVNAKTIWTVKTDIDFDDDEEFLNAEYSNVNEDNKSIDLIDDENEENNKKNKLKKEEVKGTMIFESNDIIEVNNNLNIKKENTINNENEINKNSNNAVIQNNIEINRSNNNDIEKIDSNNDNLKIIKTDKKEEDIKSESVIIEDESINHIEKSNDILITKEVNL